MLRGLTVYFDVRRHASVIGLPAADLRDAGRAAATNSTRDGLWLAVSTRLLQSAIDECAKSRASHLSGDEPGNTCGRNSREGVAEHSSERRRWIGE